MKDRQQSQSQPGGRSSAPSRRSSPRPRYAESRDQSTSGDFSLATSYEDYESDQTLSLQGNPRTQYAESRDYPSSLSYHSDTSNPTPSQSSYRSVQHGGDLLRQLLLNDRHDVSIATSDSISSTNAASPNLEFILNKVIPSRVEAEMQRFLPIAIKRYFPELLNDYVSSAVDRNLDQRGLQRRTLSGSNLMHPQVGHPSLDQELSERPGQGFEVTPQDAYPPLDSEQGDHQRQGVYGDRPREQGGNQHLDHAPVEHPEEELAVYPQDGPPSLEQEPVERPGQGANSNRFRNNELKYGGGKGAGGGLGHL